jgi:tetratricopeptide (TPR) repeat protein
MASPDHSYNASKRLANLLEQLGELEEARDILESLVSASGSTSKGETVRRGHIELQLADVYVKLEKPDLAEQYYKRSIPDLAHGPEDDPTYPALVRLVRLYLQQGRTRDAIEACQKYKKSRGASSASATHACQKLGERQVLEKGGEVTLK